ncbi:MAG: hypothetical protein JWM11_2306 [Planctomycetaceae bacterium]|nr:hypothetical protein [Planctomycetaceae bacterium]
MPSHPVSACAKLLLIIVIVPISAGFAAPPEKGKPVIRQWTITAPGKPAEKIDAELIDGKSGIVRLKNPMGAEISVTLEMLNDADRQDVYKKLGMAVIDITGIWRSDSGSYFSYSEGKDGKVYVRLLESPHLSSLDGVLMRQTVKLKSEQWICAFKGDPKNRTLSGSAYWAVLPDGRVRAHFDHWWIPNNGATPVKRPDKMASALVRLDGDNIPRHILELYIKGDADHSEEVYANAVSKMRQVILLDWYSRKRKVSVKDFLAGKGPAADPGIGEIIINAVSISVRNRMLTGILQLLFPVYTRKEQKVSQDLVFKYLESRKAIEKMEPADFKRWLESELEARLKGTDLKPDTFATFIRFMVDVHEEVKNSPISALD